MYFLLIVDKLVLFFVCVKSFSVMQHPPTLAPPPLQSYRCWSYLNNAVVELNIKVDHWGGEYYFQSTYA